MSTFTLPKPKTPIAVTLLTWLLLLTSLLNIAAGALSVYASEILEEGNTIPILAELESEETFTEPGEWFVEGIWYMLVGAGQLIITFGFWRQKRWAWVAAMSWQALKLLVEVSSALSDRVEPLPLAVAIVLVFMLNQSEVRRVFAIRPQANEPTRITPLRSFDSN